MLPEVSLIQKITYFEKPQHINEVLLQGCGQAASRDLCDCGLTQFSTLAGIRNNKRSFFI